MSYPKADNGAGCVGCVALVAIGLVLAVAGGTLLGFLLRIADAIRAI